MPNHNHPSIAKAPLQIQTVPQEDAMDALARELNASLATDFPNAKLTHGYLAKPGGPVQRAEVVLKEAVELTSQMADLTTAITGTLPQRNEPTTKDEPPMKGVLPQIAMLEDATLAAITETRALIEHIRSQL